MRFTWTLRGKLCDDICSKISEKCFGINYQYRICSTIRLISPELAQVFVHRKLRHFNKNRIGFPGLPFDYFQTGSYRLIYIHVDNHFHTRHEYDTIRGTLNLNISSSFMFSFVFKCVSPLPITTLKLFATYRDNEYFKGRLHSPYRT